MVSDVTKSQSHKHIVIQRDIIIEPSIVKEKKKKTARHTFRVMNLIY